MKRFCGLPTGVVIEPRLAATVSSTTVVTRVLSSVFSAESIMIVKGTNISSATSLVKSIEEKKTIAMRRMDSLPVFPAYLDRRRAVAPKIPLSLSPSETPIRQKSMPRVLQSMASAQAAEGGLMNAVASDRTRAMQKTVSRLMNAVIFHSLGYVNPQRSFRQCRHASEDGAFFRLFDRIQT